MTQIEVLVVIFVLFLLAGLLLSALTKVGRPSQRIPCLNNLKQTALAFIMWSIENGERFPWAVSVTNVPPGTAELAESRYAWLHFTGITNELTTPKVLVCPSDANRSRAENWKDFTSNKYLSYFVGLDAVPINGESILAGDRNLKSQTQSRNGILRIRADTTVEWGADVHKLQGNVAVADGSVHQVSQKYMRRLIDTSLAACTNGPFIRVAIPE